MYGKTREMIEAALASVVAATDVVESDPAAALDDLAAARLLLTTVLAGCAE